MSETERSTEASRDAMLSTNERQKEFYETHGGLLNRRKTGLVSSAWGGARMRMQSYRRRVGIKESIRNFQIESLGDLQDKRVLDLGCFDGNSMSLLLAKSAKEYLGIDLSENAIDKLNDKLRDIPGAKGLAVDFLSSEFCPEPFDAVYANGVMHHFEDFDAFLQVLKSHVVPGGTVVTFDPLETSIVIRSLRRMYRPFQQDADWEWPFQKSTFQTIEKHFEIERIQGFLGRAKWPIFLTPIPGCQGIAERLGSAAARVDQRAAQRQGRRLWSCMQVAMKLRRPE